MKKILLLALGLLNFSVFAQTEITDAELDEKLLVKNDKLIVLDFYATWCGPCKMMDPILEELNSELKGEVTFYKMDVDQNTTDDYIGISSVPTYIFLKNGESLGMVNGSMTKEEFKAHIDNYKDMVVVVEGMEFTPENHDAKDEFNLEIISKNSNWGDLYKIANHAYEKHEDKKTLKQAILIIEKSIGLEKNYINVKTYAALLFKLNKYNEALKKAKEALILAEENQKDTKTTLDLIKQIIDKL
ncbi:thioredoxin [Aureivirga sp. CE67]|uniref:thioredoxin n=1 Tax=Aureivirga sp. CE67 TaxID=1788983 RepID=UPI0018C8EE3D|nr:thioredoxin [Aureivirga sp. CE67]